MYRLFVVNNNGATNIRVEEWYLYNRIEARLVENNGKNEDIFLRYGMNMGNCINLNEKIPYRTLINNHETFLGSGKVFRQAIDTAKVPIKKVLIT